MKLIRQVHWNYAWNRRRMAKAIVSTRVDYGMGVWICAALVMTRQVFRYSWLIIHALPCLYRQCCLHIAWLQVQGEVGFGSLTHSYSHGFAKNIQKHLFTETSLDHSRSNETANTMQCYLQVQTLGQRSSVIDKDDSLRCVCDININIFKL